MQGFCKLLILFISLKMPLSAMHFVRVARKSPKRNIPTRHYAVDQKKHELHKKDASTTITYKGQHFTPAEFAGHIALQITAKGMNLFREYAHVKNIECPCIKPYLMLPIDNNYKNSGFDIGYAKSDLKQALHTHGIAALQLEYAIEQYRGSPLEVIKLQTLQKGQCPNLDNCCKQLSREMTKKQIRIGYTGMLIAISPFVLMPFIPFEVAGFAVWVISPTAFLGSCMFPFAATIPKELRRKTVALEKYIEYKTAEINSVLEEMVTKAPLKSITLPEIKYLSAPHKTDLH